MSMNACHCYGIVTNDYNIAKSKMTTFPLYTGLDIERYSLSKSDMYVLLKNGDYYIWIKASDNARCYRLHKAYFGKDITVEQYEYIQSQMCSAYCKEEEWI